MKVVSSCPMRVESGVWQAASGVSVVTVAAKATFVLQPTESPLAGEQEEPNAADGYWDDDERRSLHVAGDLAPRKARADVILVGAAFAPRGQPMRSLVARMVIGDVDKSIEVFADRAFALDGSLHEGQGFTKMPLTWERAAGGPHTSNPVGVRADAAPDARGWTPLPNLQPSGIHVTGRGDFIAPAGYGPISPWWPGRQAKIHRGLAGWDFRAWYEAPLPADLDDGFFNVAPPDQQTDAIRANERIVLENLLRDHPRLVTSLAPITPRARLERAAGAAQELEMRCDTLSIDTDRGTCALTWRRQLLLEQEEVVKQVVVVAGTSAPPAVKRAPPRPRAPAAVTDTLLPGKLVIAELPFVKGRTPEPASAPSSVTGTLLPGKLFTSELPFVKGSAPASSARPALPFRTPFRRVGRRRRADTARVHRRARLARHAVARGPRPGARRPVRLRRRLPRRARCLRVPCARRAAAPSPAGAAPAADDARSAASLRVGARLAAAVVRAARRDRASGARAA